MAKDDFDLSRWLSVLTSLGVFGLAALAYFFIHPVYRLTVVLGLAVPAIALLFATLARVRTDRPVDLQFSQASRRRFILVTASLFFTAFGASVFSLYVSAFQGDRGLLFFVFQWAMVALVASTLAISPRQLSQKLVVLLFVQIAIISVSFRASQLYITPGQVRDDPWFHMSLVSEILQAGQVPEGNQYSWLPIYHLLHGAAGLILGIDFKQAHLLVSSLAYGFLIPFALYSIAKYFLDRRSGMLIALISAVSNTSIQFGALATPTSLSVVWFLLCILFVICRKRSATNSMIILLLLTTVVLSHSLTALALLIILSAVLGARLLPMIKSKSVVLPQGIVTKSLTAFAWVFTLGWWAYASGHLTNLVEVLQWAVAGGGIRGSFDSGYTAVYIAQFHPLTPLMSVLGLVAFFSLALVGVFSSFSSKLTPEVRIGLLPLSLGSILIAGIGVVSGALAFGTAPDRWLFYGQILLAIHVGLIIAGLTFRRRSILKRIVVVVTLMLVLATFGTTDMIANSDTRFVVPEISPRRVFSSAELQGLGWVASELNSEVGSDVDVFTYLRYNSGLSLAPTSECLFTGNFQTCSSEFVVIRTSYRSEPVYSHGIFLPAPGLAETLSQERSLVYSSTAIMVFMKR